MYVNVKMNEKGQIVIPKAIRDEYDFQPGNTLTLVEEKHKVSLRARKSAREFKRILDNLPKIKVGAIRSDEDYDEELKQRWTT